MDGSSLTTWRAYGASTATLEGELPAASTPVTIRATRAASSGLLLLRVRVRVTVRVTVTVTVTVRVRVRVRVRARVRVRPRQAALLPPVRP